MIYKDNEYEKEATMIPIEYDMIIFKEDETYVAYCPELDVSSCGNSVEHAREMLKTAVRLFLEEAEKIGTIEDILEEARYKRKIDEPINKNRAIMNMEING